MALETLHIRTAAHSEMVNITQQIRALVRESRMKTGHVLLHVPHTTAGITINEGADPTVQHDILADLERLVPAQQRYYRHYEGNSASHLKASLFGPDLTVLVENGDLVLGTWQAIFFTEFDGPRNRRVIVRMVESLQSSGRSA